MLFTSGVTRRACPCLARALVDFAGASPGHRVNPGYATTFHVSVNGHEINGVDDAR